MNCFSLNIHIAHARISIESIDIYSIAKMADLVEKFFARSAVKKIDLAGVVPIIQ